MIPKRIIYGWFGDKPLPNIARVCINSWKRHCPDFEWLKLDKTTFDTECTKFSSEANKAGAYGIVNDVARVWALKEFGGVYMDIDMYLINGLEHYLQDKAFIGSAVGMGGKYLFPLSTGIMACEKNNAVFERKFEIYSQMDFQTYKGDIMKYFGPQDAMPDFEESKLFNNDIQRLKDITVYPFDIFDCCPDPTNGESIQISNRTVGVHLYSGSWTNKDEDFAWKRLARIPIELRA